MLRFRFLLLILAVLLAACSPQATPAPTPTTAPTPAAFNDSYGHTLDLSTPSQRIISLAPGITETLFAVGAGGQVVGRDMFSDYPSEAAALADVGGGFGELNSEVIVSLQPDLVLASVLTPPEQLQALETLGLQVFVLDNPRSLDELYAQMLQVGQMTGRAGEAAAQVGALQAREAAIDEKLAGVTERPLVFYELDSTDLNAPWTAGPGSYFDALIQQAGGVNAGSSLVGEWAQISLEQLLVQDPDLILLGSALYGGVTVESVLARPGWSEMSAIKNGQVFVFDDNLVSRPGPRLVDGLEALAKQIHPELVK